MNFTQDTTIHEDDIPNQEEIITSEQNNHEETITTEQNNMFNHEGIISNSGLPTYEEATAGQKIGWKCRYMILYDEAVGLVRPYTYCHYSKEQSVRCHIRRFCSGIVA
ncbi:hypothetical protein RCL_jg3448.t1 [Rhizophagus clarus]|uniref:Uncharacterized protein n=1 Tax=Rhizophagus clarus TaxID=94130 RepID=A0A8H3M7G5_9GLOM|nr:hypothetical protein RCL_jg3448.t1 [Rhizophagus clarus]